MALTFSTREAAPTRANPTNQSITATVAGPDALKNLDALKQRVVSALQNTKGQQSAADAISDSSFILNQNQLEIDTPLDKPMLPVVFNAEAQRLIRATLQDINPEIKYSLNPRMGARQTPQQVDELPFAKLSRRATELNAISDILSKQIEILENQLKRIGLGVSAWVTVNDSFDEHGGRYIDEIGYTRFRSRWSIALRSFSTDENQDEREEMWRFTDGPRQLRIDAVDKIPELLERLDSEAAKMVSALSEKLKKVEELTTKIKSTGGAR